MNFYRDLGGRTATVTKEPQDNWAALIPEFSVLISRLQIGLKAGRCPRFLSAAPHWSLNGPIHF